MLSFVAQSFRLVKGVVNHNPDCQTVRIGSSCKNMTVCCLTAHRVIIEISCSHVLRRLTSSQELCSRLPDYRTELGFGLHVGWAIEGAIGSIHKVGIMSCCDFLPFSFRASVVC